MELKGLIILLRGCRAFIFPFHPCPKKKIREEEKKKERRNKGGKNKSETTSILHMFRSVIYLLDSYTFFPFSLFYNHCELVQPGHFLFSILYKC